MALSIARPVSYAREDFYLTMAERSGIRVNRGMIDIHKIPGQMGVKVLGVSYPLLGAQPQHLEAPAVQYPYRLNFWC